MRRVILAAALLALGASAPARADSGTISNVHETGTGTVAASYSVEWSGCQDYGSGFTGCSWYGIAYARPASSPACLPDDGGLAWVGDFHTDPGVESVVDTFYPDEDDFRLCLYVKPEGRAPVLVAQADHSRPRLSLRAARSEARRVLRKRSGVRFRRGRGVKTSCRRTRDAVNPKREATCIVRWRYGRSRSYRAEVVLKRVTEDRIAHHATVRRVHS